MIIDKSLSRPRIPTVLKQQLGRVNDLTAGIIIKKKIIHLLLKLVLRVARYEENIFGVFSTLKHDKLNKNSYVALSMKNYFKIYLNSKDAE